MKSKKLKEGILTARTTLIARHLDKDGKELGRRVVRDKVVTSAFVNDIVDVLTATTARVDIIKNYKSHDSGTSTAAEAAGNTALTSGCGEARDSGTMDRTVFTAINVGSGDKIEFTFSITFSSGG